LIHVPFQARSTSRRALAQATATLANAKPCKAGPSWTSTRYTPLAREQAASQQDFGQLHPEQLSGEATVATAKLKSKALSCC